jgi:putative transposase
MIWVAGRSPTLVSQNLKATTLTYLAIGCKTELNLNNKQKTLAAQHAGVARHAYNWGLAICEQAMENKQRLPTAIDLHKRLVAEVKKANPW